MQCGQEAAIESKQEERKLGVNVERVRREMERRKLSRGQKCMKKLREEKHSAYVLW